MFWNRKSPLSFVPKSTIDALRANFNKAEISALIQHGTLVELEAGTTLAAEGTLGREALVVVEGQATVAREGEIIATVGAGEIVGEISLLSGNPRNATVVAETAVRAYVLSAPEFRNLLGTQPDLANRVAKLAVDRLVQV